MVVEARRHAIRFVWLYVVFGFAIAITFPLFLIARERRLAIGAGSSRPEARRG